MTTKEQLRELYLGLLFSKKHGNIYSFHHLSEYPDIIRSEKRIDEQLFKQFVLEHGIYVSLDDFFLADNRNGLSCITIDDGLEDVYTIAYPFFKEYDIPFAIFVSSNLIGHTGYLTKQQLLELADDPIVTIGSHGLNHINFGRSSDKRQESEIIRSKAAIEDLTGKECRYIAYPFGSYNEKTIELTKLAGYKNGFIVKGRPVNTIKNPYTVPRLSVSTETAELYWNS